MNEKPRCSLIRGRSLEAVPTREAEPSPPVKPQDGQTPTRSTERVSTMQCSYTKNNSSSEGDAMLVIVDSSCHSDPSSKEILVNQRTIPTEPCRTYLKKNKFPSNLPSTSKGQGTEISMKRESISKEELPMIEINLSSEQEIPLDTETESESIVVSYLRNKDVFSDIEGSLVSTKKKSSLFEGVPKMETIQEGGNIFSLSNQQNDSLTPISEISPDLVHTKSEEKRQQLSDDSLEQRIPSFPGTPEVQSLWSDDSEDVYAEAVQRLHEDHDFLLAAECGNETLLRIILAKKGNREIHKIDMLGRNALHLAVCSGNIAAIKLLLDAGVNPNVKDDIGMTPLSLCLMRSRSLEITKLLFEYGAVIIKRTSPMNTGLFLQFVIMSTPTKEEVSIMRLLVAKGALVDDPTAPGGRQALHFAAMSNNCKLIQVLISLGADPFLTNDRDETPREIAILFQCKEAVRLLEQIEETAMYGVRDSICSDESLIRGTVDASPASTIRFTGPSNASDHMSDITWKERIHRLD